MRITNILETFYSDDDTDRNEYHQILNVIKTGRKNNRELNNIEYEDFLKNAILKYGGDIINYAITTRVSEDNILTALEYADTTHNLDFLSDDVVGDVLSNYGYLIHSEDAKQKIWSEYGVKAVPWIEGAPIELLKKALVNVAYTNDKLQIVATYCRNGKAFPNELIQPLLTNKYLYIRKNDYEKIVHILFKNNNLLINKWIRYGEKMRSTS
jgi:hypothetical protein